MTMPAFTDQDLAYLIYCGIALGVLLVFTGGAQLLSRRENHAEAKSRRMRMIAKGRNTAELLALLKPAPKRGILSRLPLVGDLPHQLRRAGLTLRADQFVAICVLLTILVFAAIVVTFSPTLALPLALTIGLALPVVVVKARCKSQTTKLLHQLPDAMDMMARGLKVGHPLNNSIGAVAREMADPIGTEFGIVFDQVNYGDDLPDAFQEFAERVDIEDVYYLAASIGIQHGTGGDLASVIETLSRTIRDRIAIRRKIRAISSEGRLSAWFLSSLPVVIFGFTSFTAPDYYAGVMGDPMFKPMAAAIIVMSIANMLILKKLVEFRI